MSAFRWRWSKSEVGCGVKYRGNVLRDLDGLSVGD